MIGTTLGPYRIDAEAGSGGMGVVYRATDTALRRAVAIKILNPIASADPERKRRFIQEAQAASALNHSDIVTIYQIGRDGATDYIAMEFVAGKPLDEVIDGRPMKPADAVRIAARIAGALAAAHRAGIVHRDLKPANVMITPEGGVKLLDFGVAKLAEIGAGSATALTREATATGLVVGTLAYMSPEQREGTLVDARSDIYSFGLLLHEMLAGRRLSGEFDAAALAGAPRDVRRIVARCLRRDPAERFQMMDDVRHALEDAEVTTATAAAPAAPSRGLALAATAGALALVALAVWAWAGRSKGETAAVPPVLTRVTIDSGLTTDPALSPDGRLIAFASDRAGTGNLDVWIRQVAGGDPVQLTHDASDDQEPSFSNDGSRIAFRSDRDGGGVYTVSSLGGGERRIADAGRRPRWSPDGERIAYWTGLNTAFLISAADAPRIFVVPAAGGEPQRLFKDFAVAYNPVWSADGSSLLFLGRRQADDESDWWIARSDGSEPRASGAVAAIGAAHIGQVDGLYVPDNWTADGRVLFSGRLGDATNVYALGIGADKRASAAPVRVTAGTAIESGATSDRAGTIAYAATSTDIDLWSLRIDPASGMAAGTAQRLTEDPATDAFPALSPDGARLIYASNRSGAFDVWLKDLSSGREAIVAARFTFPSLPSLTPDGGRVIYQSATEERWVSVPAGGVAAGSIAPQVVCDGCDSFWDVSADGWAVFGTDRDSRVMARNTATGTTIELLTTPGAIVGRFRVSPDGRWLAFNHREHGTVRIIVAPFAPPAPSPPERWIAVTSGDTIVNAATWSRDGGTLYYLSNRDGSFCVWGQRLDRATARPLGDPLPVWHFHEARRAMWRIPMGWRGMTASRDRIVVSVAESAGNIWLAK